MNSTLPGESAAAPQPPFESVQVMDCLPPVPNPCPSVSTSQPSTAIAPSAPSSETGSFSGSVKARQRRDNPTGLVRSEIRLLAEAVEEARTWRGTMTGNPDPRPLAEFDARIERMRAAIRKLKAASGYTFSGGRKR
jgi:hypothetical protein